MYYVALRSSENTYGGHLEFETLEDAIKSCIVNGQGELSGFGSVIDSIYNPVSTPIGDIPMSDILQKFATDDEWTYFCDYFTDDIIKEIEDNWEELEGRDGEDSVSEEDKKAGKLDKATAQADKEYTQKISKDMKYISVWETNPDGNTLVFFSDEA